MKLSNDCVRDILLYIESIPANQAISSESVFKEVGQDKYSEEEVIYAIKKMIEGNLLSGSLMKAESGTMTLGAYIMDITYEGHQYLETIRSPKAWAYAKEKAGELGSFSFKTLGMFAQQYIKKFVNGEL
ncbi:DUF2513 domain-containing protein [Salinicoccus roseus]|uniref:DUF2513 domain-containing protein n=1 Tax=Salinicoccus roseus TaxID=45670 RepID=UPI0022FFDAFB|nr:DUF2513 domain-containing protein [Salinicoccus roseus]